MRSNVAFFQRVLEQTDGLESILELGANRGLNIEALHELYPQTSLEAVEINPHAVERLRELPLAAIHHKSIFEFEASAEFDLVFTKCVLIHIAPEKLSDVYDLLHKCSRRFILLAEYYNPTPMVVQYRGHDEKLFKRDFAGEILKRFSNLRLVDYGFVYHGDPNPQDDVTWFLLEKTNQTD